ncbi:MAG: amidase, partial [Acidimicrobiia bacterium]|nr:amidase [Acidimicrobiia bacterium]
MTNTEKLWMMGAVEGAERLARREIKPSEWMASVVGRIEAMNPSLNAITIDLTEQAMDAAVAADERIATDPAAEL